jgi:hypothetical protein
MPERARSVRVVSLQSELLSVADVQRVARELAALDGDVPEGRVIDGSALGAVTPEGLAALHELGRSSAATLALAGLSRTMTRVAVEAKLAQTFDLYASVAAFTRAREAGEERS